MKDYLVSCGYFLQRVVFYFFLTVVALVSTGQDKKEIDINVSTHKDNFWEKPWVWVVGAAIFILLLAAILRGGKRRV